MAKKIILALIILIIIAIFLGNIIINNQNINIYIDGENITAQSSSQALNEEICNYSFEQMENPNTNITTLKEGIVNISHNYGFENPTINVDSSIGSDCIPIVFNVDGRSMLPTLQDGQKVLVNKTKNIHVGDIVVADSPTYGNIVKRVEEIDNNQVYLVSDNKNIEITQKDGITYQSKGITTWVDISNIYGVVIKY